MALYVLTDYWVDGYAEGESVAAVFEDAPPISVASTIVTPRIGNSATRIQPGALGGVVTSSRGGRPF